MVSSPLLLALTSQQKVGQELLKSILTQVNEAVDCSHVKKDFQNPRFLVRQQLARKRCHATRQEILSPEEKLRFVHLIVYELANGHLEG